MRQRQPVGAGEQKGALETELAQLVGDGVHHVAPLGLAAEARRGGGERAQVLPRPRQVGQRPLPFPLLRELQGRFMADAPQGPQERAPGLAIEHQPEKAGGIALDAQGNVRAPELGRGQPPQVERMRDFRRAARQVDAAFQARIGQHARGDQLLEPARGRLPPRPGRSENPAHRGLDEMGLRVRSVAQQVAAKPQLGHQGSADRRGVVHDDLPDALLHNAKLPHLTPRPKRLISAPPPEE